MGRNPGGLRLSPGDRPQEARFAGRRRENACRPREEKAGRIPGEIRVPGANEANGVREKDGRRAEERDRRPAEGGIQENGVGEGRGGSSEEGGPRRRESGEREENNGEREEAGGESRERSRGRDRREEARRPEDRHAANRLQERGEAPLARLRESDVPLLRGLRVIDASQFNAGPIASLYLAGYGAEVVKVERPGGEDSRAIGPFKGGESSYFMSLNRGKRSITLNLKTPEGVEVFKKLCRGADVLVENLLPGVMDRLGAGWSVLKAENPRLVYGAVSGFGPTGKNAARPAFDSLLQAAGGLISVTGPAGGAPVRVGVSIVDVASGLYLLSGILTALWRRERSGEGTRVDVSMMGAAVNLMENPVARHAFTGEVPGPAGLSHPVVSPFSGYRTKDGLLFVAISNTSRFRALAEALDMGALADDPRFRENADRVANDDALRAILEEALARRTTAEWEERLVPRGVPASAINDVARVKERFPEAFVEVEHPTAGSALLPASPLAFEGETPDFSRPAPRAGEHTEEILAELGCGAEEVARLREAGAIQPPGR